MGKFKISVKYTYGPCATREELKAMQAQIKQQTSKMHFGKAVKTSKGYKFDGTATVTETSDATVSQIKQAVSSQYPRAKVTVKKVMKKEENYNYLA